MKDPANSGNDPRKVDSQDRPPKDDDLRDEATLRLFAEELSVTKEKLDSGRVRVATHTHEREALVEEDLARERVEIETIPIGRRISTVPEVRQEGDATIIPVVEEVLVVERQLMLKEEVHIRRIHTTERHQEKVTLRHQEAVVTRHQPDTGDAKS
jgi:uncharacterized protein (TIGR02271 family)